MELDFTCFIEKDITLFTKYGHTHRGILKDCVADVLGMEVGLDLFFILGDSIYAVVEHGY